MRNMLISDTPPSTNQLTSHCAPVCKSLIQMSRVSGRNAIKSKITIKVETVTWCWIYLSWKFRRILLIVPLNVTFWTACIFSSISEQSALHTKSITCTVCVTAARPGQRSTHEKSNNRASVGFTPEVTTVAVHTCSVSVSAGARCVCSTQFVFFSNNGSSYISWSLVDTTAQQHQNSSTETKTLQIFTDRSVYFAHISAQLVQHSDFFKFIFNYFVMCENILKIHFFVSDWIKQITANRVQPKSMFYFYFFICLKS